MRSAFTLVSGENPTIDPLNPAVAEARWQSPVRRVSIFRMDGGKIAEMWEVWDTLGFLQQLGVIPAQ